MHASVARCLSCCQCSHSAARIDDGANISSPTTVTGMPAAQGTRRSKPGALGVSDALEPSHNRRQARGSTSRLAHRCLLRDGTPVPCLRVVRQALQRNVDPCLQTPMHVQSGCCIASRAAWRSRAHVPVSHHTRLRRSNFALARVFCSTSSVFHMDAALFESACSLVHTPPPPHTHTNIHAHTRTHAQ